ncbi:MAG TPA: STAS domain-containing protein [Anaerolineales bacterium]
MSVEFQLSKEIPSTRADVAILHVGGWLDAQGEDKLVAAVKEAHEQGAKYVLIDLGGVSLITSAGIRAIQRSYTLLTPKRGTTAGRLKLCNASPQVYEVLSITGMLLSVPMYEGQDIAVDSFGK